MVCPHYPWGGANLLLPGRRWCRRSRRSGEQQSELRRIEKLVKPHFARARVGTSLRVVRHDPDLRYAVAGLQATFTPGRSGQRAFLAVRNHFPGQVSAQAQNETRVEKVRRDAGDELMSNGVRRAEHVSSRICALLDTPDNWVPFLGIGLQQLRDGLAVQDHSKLPAEIDHVLDAGVHALTAGRAVSVSGLSAEEDAAVAPYGRGTWACREPAAPGHVGHLDRYGRAFGEGIPQVVRRGLATISRTRLRVRGKAPETTRA